MSFLATEARGAILGLLKAHKTFAGYLELSLATLSITTATTTRNIRLRSLNNPGSAAAPLAGPTASGEPPGATTSP